MNPNNENEELFNSTLQQRSDYIPLDELKDETSDGGELFKSVVKELTNKGLRTIVGPRGAGKTHMMRYAWLSCRDQAKLPFAVYVTFNRYFRLEPLLSTRADATQQFHSWVLARVLLAVIDSWSEWDSELVVPETIVNEFDLDALTSFVAKTERSQPLDDASLEVSNSLSIEKVQKTIDELCQIANRKFTVLFLDDAALTLTPDFLIEFLDIVRSFKSTTIAPKASVYPGTTEVSPKFHQGQDSISIPVWISIEDSKYDVLMQDIAIKRIKNLSEIPKDAQDILRFASFGIPRAYLTMLDEYSREQYSTTQQGVNRIVQEHLEARLSEFRTLGIKVPKLESLIKTGEDVLDGIAKAVKTANETLAVKREKQLTWGANENELTPIVERMFKLLVEAGLIFDGGNIKHGSPARIYKRFIPHTSLMLSIRAIGSEGTGGSLRQTLEGIGFKSTKHPIRKSLKSLVPNINFNELALSLPKCGACDTRRLSDSQRFCHNCGRQLVDASTFNKCLETKIISVPSLTKWQINQIENHLPNLITLRDFMAKQDPAADLLTVRGFGIKRSARIVDVLNSFADDYLS